MGKPSKEKAVCKIRNTSETTYGPRPAMEEYKEQEARKCENTN